MNLAITSYKPIVEKPEVYAAQEYDNQTVDQANQLRKDLGKEFKELEKQGQMQGKKAGAYVNPKVKAF